MATAVPAYELAFAGVSLQTNAEAPADPSGPIASAANARLALLVASLDLHNALDKAPATPTDLHDAVYDLATEYRTITSHYLAGETNDSKPIADAIPRAGTAAEKIAKICQ
ncbi:MAG: hypothetical protein LLG14_05965 [Nocardiaceae bacterium]|nr:hypothetical protein [Nocardiaceae bacterium]